MDSQNLTKYKYYDSPDGEDCFYKLFYTTKIAGLTGIGAGTFDILYNSNPRGFAQTARRYGYYIGPLVGMAAAFTATTCLATTIRKKDDQWNYAFGGLASGSIVGLWTKNRLFGFACSLALAVAGAIKKDSIVNNWRFYPEVEGTTSFMWSNTHDYTLSKDPRDSN